MLMWAQERCFQWRARTERSDAQGLFIWWLTRQCMTCRGGPGYMADTPAGAAVVEAAAAFK